MKKVAADFSPPSLGAWKPKGFRYGWVVEAVKRAEFSFPANDKSLEQGWKIRSEQL